MLSFLNKRVRKLEFSIKTKMDAQLADWLDNIDSEQIRVGETIREYAQDKLSK